MGCSIGFRSTKPQGHVGKHLPDWPKPRARTTSGTWRISSWPWMKPSVEPLRTPTKINGITGYYKASPDSSNLSVDIAPAIGLSKRESSLFARFAPDKIPAKSSLSSRGRSDSSPMCWVFQQPAAFPLLLQFKEGGFSRAMDPREAKFS